MPESASIHGRPEQTGITIDGPTSRDLDDAFWVTPTSTGVLLSISIADVTEVVPRGSAEDVRAREMGFTRYLPTRIDPMLPTSLSENAVSLLPGQERAAITLTLPLSRDGHVGAAQVTRTRLRSEAKLNYADASAAITTLTHRYHAMLRTSYGLAKRLLGRRRQRGALALFDLASGWRTSEDGTLRRMRPDEAHPAQLIIQEYMILANESFARYLLEADVPTLFRNHTARAAAGERADLLADIESALADPKFLDIEQVRARVYLVLNRARYSPLLHGHWGLNLPAYLHGTSPIRRYADLLNQRQLVAHLEGVPVPYTVEDLAEIAVHLNAIEDNQKDARTAYLHDRAHVIARRVMQRPATLAAVTGKDLERVLKVAARENQLTPVLDVYIHQELQAGNLEPLHLAVLLAESPRDVDAWGTIRQAVLLWLLDHLPIGVSTLNTVLQLLAADPPAYVDSVSGSGNAPVFRATASLQIDGVSYTTRYVWHAATKRVARQMATVDVLAQIVGVTLAEPAPMLMPEAVVIQTPTVPDDENAKGRLLEYCQKAELPRPVFVTLQHGLAHQPSFTSHAEITIAGGLIVSPPSTSGSRRDAERLAAMDLLERISSTGIDARAVV